MKKRRLFYVPGLISLIGLPILLYFMGPGEKPIWNAVKINLPSDEVKPDPYLIRFSRRAVYQSLKHKKIITVDLGEDIRSDRDFLNEVVYQKKLDFISEEIARRQFTHDTSSVLKIQLGGNCTYGDFVWVLNLAHVYDMKRFVFIDDAYYLYTNPPPERVSDLGFSDSDVVYSGPAKVAKPSAWAIFKTRISDWATVAFVVVRFSYIYVLGFILLIIVPAIIGLYIQLNIRP